MNLNDVFMIIRTKFAAFLLVALSACAMPPQAEKRTLNLQTNSSESSVESCVLIDTDFDIDDMMAIPVVMGSRHVKAIINTEGYTLAPQGASALSRFVAEPGRQSPVVIVGASFPGTRDIKKWAWLPEMRASMHRINGLLTKPLMPKTEKNRKYSQEIFDAMVGCKSISVLVIGAFTSFVDYSPAIRDRISSVVIQGRPYTSDQYDKPRLSFNCEYDLNSCQKAFDQLTGLKPVWVDVPREAVPPYSPTLEMVNGLDDVGLPGTLKAALMANQKLWDLNYLTQGNQSRLWDQLAALYLLYPDAFHLIDGHMEPRLSPFEIQNMWTVEVNKNNH